MRTSNALWMSSLALVVASGLSAAQSADAQLPGQPIEIDLAVGVVQQRATAAGPDFRLVLHNALIDAHYAIHIGPATPTLLEPLSTTPTKGGPLAALQPQCEPAKTADSRLKAATTEEELSGVIARLHADARTAKCKEQDEAVIATAIANTVRRDAQHFDMPGSSTRVVTISRAATEKRESRVWSVTLTSPERGRWLTTFGVAFAPGRDERYFLNKVGDNQLRIQRQADYRDDVTYLPGVFFTWLPRAQQLRNLNHGPTAGLGFESNRPAVFGGYHLGWNQNIGLVFGLAVHSQRRLAGRYNVGDILTDTLDDDQLHENIFRPNVIVALTLRLSTNPFQASDPDPPKKDPPKENPK